MPQPPKVPWVPIAFVAIFLATAFLVYGGTLSRPLGSDARFLTVQNAFVRDPGGFKHFWTTDYFAGAITNGVEYQSGYYRPVTNAMFWLEYRLGGDNGTFYRTSQLLLHVLTALLVSLLCSRLMRNGAAGAIAGFLFLIHPVNAFAATEPAARADVLFPVFYLGGILAFDRALVTASRGSKWLLLALATLCGVCAVLSKEPGITLPASFVLIVLLHHFRDGSPWQRLTLTAPSWIAAFGYLAWRFGALGLAPSSFGYGAVHSKAVLFLASIKSVGIQVSRVLIPLEPGYPELNPRLVNHIDTTFTEPLTYIAVAGVVAICVLAFQWKRKPLLAFWSGFFLVTYSLLLRVDNIQGTLNTNMILSQERWIYLSSVAIFAAAGWGAITLFEKSKPRRVRMALIAGGIGISLVLGRSASIHAGKHQDPFAQLQQLYLFPDEQLSRLERASKLMLYARWVATPMGDIAEAEARTREAVRIVQDSPITAAALADALALGGKWSEVLTVLEPWLDPSREELEVHHQTNVRVGDDLNRVNPRVALLLAEARARLGPPEEAALMLCRSAERQAPEQRTLEALRISYANFGPNRCHLSDDPSRCAENSRLPATPPWRPPFNEASCRTWLGVFRGDSAGINDDASR